MGHPTGWWGLRLGNRIRETLRVIPDQNRIQTSTGRASVVQRNWANDEQGPGLLQQKSFSLALYFPTAPSSLVVAR